MLTLHPSDVEVGERHRALSDDAVNRLAASMKEIGLRHPISVRVVDEMMVDGKATSGVPVLVAGAHRLAAAKLLGWDEIDCMEVDDDSVTAELWEISENLHRLDLTKDQRDEHIRRYAELIKTQRALPRQNDAPTELRSDGRKKGPQHEKGVAREIAEETGISVRTVQRALNPPPEPKNPLPDHDVETVQFNTLMAAWNRAGTEARERFIDSIDGAL